MANLCEGGNEPAGSLKAIYILRHHMMKDEWNGEKFSPTSGLEPGFSSLRADVLSTKPHRIRSDIGMGIWCGLVYRTSARRAENPGSNPDASDTANQEGTDALNILLCGIKGLRSPPILSVAR
ncbi:hypothetical protein ANN_14538 [Periplaneta americana]|uniref:Uncharacterized protein n=1 Tax=Periplaneta americana TaxID=6978 RepID=A0ABQ8SXT6_PERAM|nr:hypothetical protein ANN_14538 [Periplaneta americana]